jgi:AcrR family transcriptional regulator
MKDARKKNPGRPRSVKSHQAMLAASLELLGEVGYSALSIEAIAKRAKIGKTTIYRRYSSKSELVADAIESIREEVIIPDTDSLEQDIEGLIENAAQITLNPLGRQAMAMIISSAASNSQFAQIYEAKYLEPRRQAFAMVFDRAKARDEVPTDLDSDLFFDAMSGIMLYATIFPPDNDWSIYVKRALSLLLKSTKF